MEKADILEMTVAYLRATHCRRRSSLDAASAGSADRYAAGFRECAVHVGQFLLDAGVSFGAVHDRLMSHLDKTLQTVVDVDGCGRLPCTGFDPIADVATEKMLWTGDCDTTGRCSPDTDDDDDCRSVSGTVNDVDDVIRWQYAGRETTVTTSVQPLTDTTTTTTYRQPLHPGAEADSPRSADEFPSFLPSTAATAADDCSSSLPSDVVSDVDNDLVVARDVGRDVKVPHRVTSSDSKSSPIYVSDTITDDSADVWRPW